MTVLSSKMWKSSLDDVRLPFSTRVVPSCYRPRWESGSSMRRVSSVQSINHSSSARISSMDSFYSSNTSIRQRSRSRERSISSEFSSGYGDLPIRKSSYSWRKNFDMNFTREDKSAKLSDNSSIKSVESLLPVSNSSTNELKIKDYLSNSFNSDDEIIPVKNTCNTQKDYMNTEKEKSTGDLQPQTKVKLYKVGTEEVRLKEVTSPKLLEDHTSNIMAKVRNQRKSLQAENSSRKTEVEPSGWRAKLMDCNISKNENAEMLPACKDINGINVIKNIANQIKRKLSIGKGEGPIKYDDATENEFEDSYVPYKPSKFSNPLDFIFLKEENDKKNPPKKKFVKERSVDSDCGKSTLESVMDSLKKFVKAVNPKHEFPSDIARKQKEELIKATNNKKRLEINDELSPTVTQAKKYNGCNFFGSRWRSCQDLRTSDEHKKAIRDGVQIKVLSRLNAAVYPKDDHLKDHLREQIVEIKRQEIDLEKQFLVVYATVQVTCTPVRETVVQESHLLLENDELKELEIFTHPQYYTARYCFERMDDSEDELCHHLITRNNATWEKVKPISDGIKKKCELFAPRANNVGYKNATVTIEAVCDYEQAVENKTFLVNFAIEEVLQEQTVTMTDFVFSMCFSLSQDDLVQVINIFLYLHLFFYIYCHFF